MLQNLTYASICQIIHKEIITHAQLRHENIIPLLGVYGEENDDSPVMVLPYIERGGVLTYLEGFKLPSHSDDSTEILGNIVSLSLCA